MQPPSRRAASAGAVLDFESANLHAIAADLHIAPPAGVILAGVKKEPATVRGRAGADGEGVSGGDEIHGRLRQHPQRKPGIILGRPQEPDPR